MQTFPLPNLVVAPGARVLVRGAVPNRIAARPTQAPISLPTNIIPHWYAVGAVELLKTGSASRSTSPR